MKRVTIAQAMAWQPCGWDGPDNGENYTEARVRQLFGRRKYMTALQMLNLDIPYEDRLWAVLHDELIEARIMRLFACDVAERALRHERLAGGEPDSRSWEALRVSRRYAVGKATEEELAAAEAAGAAAWEAAKAAAWVAAGVAARNAAGVAGVAARNAAGAAAAAAARNAAGAAAGAAWVAAWEAARVAAGAAARVAAWAAAVEAAWAAERKWQVGHLRKMLRREGV